MRTNEALRLMKQGKPALGAALCFGAPIAGEYLAMSGYDFVLVDNQHGLWDDESCFAAYRCIYLGNSTPMLRVPKNDYYAIGRALDRGALGIIVPIVNSVEEAEAAAYAVRYPPRGGRSAGAVGTGFLRPDYQDRIDDEVFLAVQIESQTAAEHAEEILAVEGVDGCWVGPADLALSMGIDRGTPAHEQAILHVIDACHKTGKIPGIASTPQTVQHWLDKGMLFVTCVSDVGLICQGEPDLLSRLRKST